MARRLRGLDTTALLGLTGTVVAALLSAGFIGDFLVNPAVYVELKNNTASKPMMLVTNDGSQPAHNLSVYSGTLGFYHEYYKYFQYDKC